MMRGYPEQNRVVGQKHARPVSHISSTRFSPRRSGFTLVELMVVISMVAVLISLAGMTFHLLLRSEKQVSQSFVTERAISQLAVLFRTDCHQAESSVLTSDRETGVNELALSDAKGLRVRYIASATGLIRLGIDGDQVVSREDFRLPECRVSFSSGRGSDDTFQTLLIERPGASIVRKEQAPLTLRSLRIESHLHPAVNPASDEESPIKNPSTEVPE